MSTNKKSLLSGSKSTKKASVAKSSAGTKGAKIESMRISHSKRSVEPKAPLYNFRNPNPL